MNTNLSGKTAIVTGGGAGIGREICLELARAGCAVAVCDVQAEAAGQVAAEVSGLGFTGVARAVDVSDYDSVEMTCSALEQSLGPIGILVNNAGITRDGLLMRMSQDDFDRVIAVNLKGTFNFSKACCRSMMKHRWGRIINISSVVGQMGNAGQANYAAAKAGMIGLTKSLAREFASRNITVNAVAPGFITTAMTERLDRQTRDTYLASIPLKRFGTPSDVAGVCLFLASERAAYITGQVIRVDGGMLM